jgi:hypothetical protein
VSGSGTTSPVAVSVVGAPSIRVVSLIGTGFEEVETDRVLP